MRVATAAEVKLTLSENLDEESQKAEFQKWLNERSQTGEERKTGYIVKLTAKAGFISSNRKHKSGIYFSRSPSSFRNPKEAAQLKVGDAVAYSVLGVDEVKKLSSAQNFKSNETRDGYSSRRHFDSQDGWIGFLQRVDCREGGRGEKGRCSRAANKESAGSIWQCSKYWRGRCLARHRWHGGRYIGDKVSVPKQAKGPDGGRGFSKEYQRSRFREPVSKNFSVTAEEFVPSFLS